MNGAFKTMFSQGIHQVSEKQKEELGCVRYASGGRKFVYCQNGASAALDPGKVVAAPSAVANHINKAVGAVIPVGTKVLNITVGATAVAQNQYADGWLQVNDADNEGHQVRILSNTACDASGTTELVLEDGLPVALAATSEVSLIPSKFRGVAVAGVNSLPVGVPCLAVPAAFYFWAQVKGVANVLMSGTPAVGSMIVTAASGAAAAMAGTLDIDNPIIGIMGFTAGVTTEYKPVDLNIA
ncbi:hypothetical protein [Oceanidesulfovibrio marinus]|uniref:Uncharacterized protein n=1 Tax=Oceanidesulfovibrio marinus TaxID=370038 RepID=A0A6P1ZB30_9BACT|nr:hypothetical protein [Oceanidesulfovibrio marinus]TVM31164.1 hypothetical protein DQK91_18820 [Oceanidesulfovibrio marinus]